MVYDILLNFNYKAFEFYEWEQNDNIIHIKSIPKYKVEDKILNDFLKNKIKIDSSFLNEINNKTYLYYKDKVKKANYSCILYNDEIALAFLFNKEGILIGKSNLIFEESDEIVNNNDKDITDIKYNIITKLDNKKYLTRKEEKTKKNIIDYLNYLYTTNKFSEIKYLYYEYFDCSENNILKMHNKLVKSINYDNNKKINELSKLIKVLKK